MSKFNQIIKTSLIAVCLAVLMGFQYVQPVGAISDRQKQIFREGIYFYNTAADEGGSCGDGTGQTVALSGNDNAEKIYNYYVAKGLSPIGSAGIDGNFGQESTWNPTASGGYLAQWGGGRLANLEKFAQAAGKPVTDLQVQLDFSWQELTTSYKDVLAHVKAATTIEDATEQFMGPDSHPIKGYPEAVSGGYENPGLPNLARRISLAKGILAKYGGSAGAAATVTSVISGGDCSSVVGNGQSTTFVDGFTVYSQCDPSWGKIPLGDGDICANGCGPSAMAMIVTNLTKQSVTPDQTTALVKQNNLYVNGTGSSWSIGKVLAEHYGLKATPVGDDVIKITAALRAGALVIAAGSGALPFTSGGHFIVIRGVTADGKWRIGDSGHRNTSSQDWDPAQIVASVHGHEGSLYAISK